MLSTRPDAPPKEQRQRQGAKNINNEAGSPYLLGAGHLIDDAWVERAQGQPSVGARDSRLKLDLSQSSITVCVQCGENPSHNGLDLLQSVLVTPPPALVDATLRRDSAILTGERALAQALHVAEELIERESILHLERAHDCLPPNGGFGSQPGAHGYG
eukprot:scaffold182375_cov32-Tisochrysis_lutea.AAC.2